jgi:hypothetical protein
VPTPWRCVSAQANSRPCSSQSSDGSIPGGITPGEKGGLLGLFEEAHRQAGLDLVYLRDTADVLGVRDLLDRALMDAAAGPPGA